MILQKLLFKFHANIATKALSRLLVTETRIAYLHCSTYSEVTNTTVTKIIHSVSTKKDIERKRSLIPKRSRLLKTSSEEIYQ